MRTVQKLPPLLASRNAIGQICLSGPGNSNGPYNMHIFFIFSSWSFSEWQSVGILRDFPHFAVLQQKGTSKLLLCRVSQRWSNVQVNECTMNIKFTWRWCNARSDWLQEASQGWEWILFADHQFLVLVRYVAFDITLKNKWANKPHEHE